METIPPSASAPSLERGSLSRSCSFSLYFVVIASSYGNHPESIFYTSRVFFRLNFLSRDGRYGWLSERRENATSNTERTKKSVSFRVDKVDYWFHGRVFERPYRAAPCRAAPRHGGSFPTWNWKLFGSGPGTNRTRS